MILQPCQLWALCLLLCVAVLFIPDRYCNTSKRIINGIILCVIIASLAGMQAYVTVSVLFLVLAIIVFAFGILHDQFLGVNRNEF
jgi:uncharacterized membrane protein